MKRKTAQWLHGLIGGFIGGGASSVCSTVSAGLIAPQSFNLTTEVPKTLMLFGTTFLLNGLLVAFAYLRQAPLPPLNGDTELFYKTNPPAQPPAQEKETQ